ncbi:MAG: type II toxin-antitoxin system HicA family toxin [Agathobacter sp.]
MSTFEKRYQKFCRKPIPNDITFEEVETIAKHFGCIVEAGSNHMKIIHPPSGTVIPIPRHKKSVGEAYIKQLKKLFESIN